MSASAEKRRQAIATFIRESAGPVTGLTLSQRFGISRQIAVRDIRILRSKGVPLGATNRGYVYLEWEPVRWTVKVRHTDAQTLDELLAVVELGGRVLDVFVKHRVYGELRVQLNIGSRKEVWQFWEGLSRGHSNPLMNVTNGYHYHTLEARDEQAKEKIMAELRRRQYIVPWLPYEYEEDMQERLAGQPG